jgi:predicted nuclease of predicted toxin-antitoxin system
VRWLADENIHGDVVAWLRSLGEDVVYAAEIAPRSSDEDVLARAAADCRTLITDDKDFGELVFRRRLLSSGVVLLRLADASIRDRLDRLRRAWPVIQRHGRDCFIVIGDRTIRVRPIVRRP